MIRRCAIYTRKSSDEGLDQAFNSLDAQREACAAYIRSQASEGWVPLPALYDDGGFSGGSMERPALKRLLDDMDNGLIDVIVVYKIDRLTRSLADFARIVERLDARSASFVSVTQAFNTTTSMGRLTLNVLLSFAQFEREVTGERIRDKIAASKAKGMWMGGTLPLGYDLPVSDSRALAVNHTEAISVRHIFARYLTLGSVHALERDLAEQGIVSKRATARNGTVRGGCSFSRGALFHLLRNKTYLGEIVHGNLVHPGLHEAIVDRALFEAVQDRLDVNRRRRVATATSGQRAALVGRLFDGRGEPLSPTTSKGRNGRAYRYYVSASLQQGRTSASGLRVSAPAFEALVCRSVCRLAGCAAPDALGLVKRIELHKASVHLLLPVRHLAHVREHLLEGEAAHRDHAEPSLARLILPVSSQLRGGRTSIVSTEIAPPRRDKVLIAALRRAHAMTTTGANGLPSLEAAPGSPYRRQLVRLAFLAPDIQRAIIDGRQQPQLTLATLMKMDIPIEWDAQRQAINLKLLLVRKLSLFCAYDGLLRTEKSPDVVVNRKLDSASRKLQRLPD